MFALQNNPIKTYREPKYSVRAYMFANRAVRVGRPLNSTSKCLDIDTSRMCVFTLCLYLISARIFASVNNPVSHGSLPSQLGL